MQVLQGEFGTGAAVVRARLLREPGREKVVGDVPVATFDRYPRFVRFQFHSRTGARSLLFMPSFYFNLIFFFFEYF